MSLTAIDLPPGIARHGTKYASKGRWYDANLVRFLDGTVRPVGGWGPLTTAGLAGSPVLSASYAAGTTTISVTVATGTLSGSIMAGATLTIAGETGTPRHTVTNGPYYPATGATSIASVTFTTALATGCTSGAAVTFSGTGQPVVAAAHARAALGWLAATGGQAYLAIAHVNGLQHYSEGVLKDITPTSFVSGHVDASRSAATTRQYGGGFYGAGAYGVTQRLQGRFIPPDTWTLDTLSDWLVGAMAQSDGHLYVFRPGTDTLAVRATSTTGTAPISIRAVVVTAEGFLMALGADGDPRLVKWASQGTTDTWLSTATNSAGDYSLETSGQLLVGKRGIGETLLWTDTDVIAAIYVGGDLIYSFQNRGHNCGALSPGAVARLDAKFAWMGNRSFYVYDGYAHPLPCEVADYVFSDFNYDQAYKVSTFVNSAFGEVWWFYPSLSQAVVHATALECDRYVMWNYRENTWNIGALARSCGVEPGNGFATPVLVAPTGEVYLHEIGWTHGSSSVYLESGPFELGDGDRVVDAEQLVPDEKIQGEVQATFYTQFYPNATEYTAGPYAMANPTDVRFLGRHARLRLDQVVETDWRVGRLRLDLEPAGQR